MKTAEHPAVTYLLAAHERAVALADAATKGPWTVDDEGYPEEIHGLHGADVITGSRWAGEASVFDSDADAVFIVANHPGTALARIAAEREVLWEHTPEAHEPDRCAACVTNRILGPDLWVADLWPCRTVLALAKGWGWTE
jgi:hypothetical protein